LEEFVKKIGDNEKLPVIHVRVEGKDVDRQGVHQTLSDVLTGKVLTFRQVIVEESEMRLPELKPGSFHINQVLKDYLKDEKAAQLAVEMLKYLRQGDTEGAKSVADGYFQRLKGGEEA